MIECVRAQKQHLRGIDVLIQQTWPNEQVILPVAEAMLSAAHHALYVLHQPLNGRIAGVVSAFGMPSALADHVWWIDQIAVAADLRGHGQSRHLVEAALNDPQAQDASLAAAIVRADNHPAQHAFRSTGFEAQVQVFDLLIWPPADRMPVLRGAPEDLHIMMVDTLTYQGIWLEGLDPATQEPGALADAVTLARALGGLTHRPYISSLIPADKVDLLPRSLRRLSQSGGRFHRWLRPLQP